MLFYEWLFDGCTALSASRRTPMPLRIAAAGLVVLVYLLALAGLLLCACMTTLSPVRRIGCGMLALLLAMAFLHQLAGLVRAARRGERDK